MSLGNMADSSAGYVVSDLELQEFKTDYYTAPGGNFNLEIQAPHLAKLAEGYLNRYKVTGKWTDILKSHALSNSVNTRTSRDANLWSQKVFEVQQTYWGAEAVWTYETHENVMSTLAEELENIRKDVRIQLASIEELVKKLNSLKIQRIEFLDQFHNGVKRISLDCTNSMINFACKVFEFSVLTLTTQPPCPFCVVALGSLAKGEATPYSDLEYLFIIERESPDTLEYFEKLAMSSYFIIGNLKETELGYMSIAELNGWYEDKQKSGFKIDGLKKKAGNIPTGNGLKDKDNHLIVTPAALLSRYEKVLNNPKVDEEIRGDFTAMLQYTKLIYSSGESAKSLLDVFCDGKNVLLPGAKRHEANRKLFIADAKKYSFKPTEKLIDNGFSINTKIELYRYPSILLNNLSIIFEYNQSSSWESLQYLLSQNLISQSIHTAISFLLSCACYFRLSTYLFYDSADDRLSVLPTNYFLSIECQSKIGVSKKSGQRWFLSQELFNMHCDYSIPLKGHIRLCEVNSIESKIREKIGEANWLVKFQTYHCCNRWSKGQGHFQEHISESSVLNDPEQTIAAIYRQVNYDFRELWNSVKALTYSLCQNRQYKESLPYHLIIQRMLEADEGPDNIEDQHLIMADTKAESAQCRYDLHMFEEATQEFFTSLEIRSRYLPENHELLAKMHSCLGGSFNMMYHYKEAEEHLLTALQMCLNQTFVEQTHDYYGDVALSEEISHPLVDLLTKTPEERLIYLNNPTIILAHILWKLGRTYFYSKYYQRAFLYLDKSREMFLQLYGNDACHRDIAYVLYTLGCTSDMLGMHCDTEIYYRRSLDMVIQLYNKTNRFQAALLRVLAVKLPFSYHKLLINAFYSVKRYRIPHLQSATVASRYGFYLVNIGEHKLAEFVLNGALDMYKKSTADSKYASGYVSNTLSHLALNSWKMGNITSAEKFYLESIDMVEKSTQSIPKSGALEVGEILQGMGKMYEHIHQYDAALQCYLNAKEKFLFACNDQNHPKIMETQLQILLVSKVGRNV